MKKNLSLILILWLLAAGFPPTPAVGQEVEQNAQEEVQQQEIQQAVVDDAISRVELKKDSLPEGFEITSEIRATIPEIYKVREKIGFPITALVNQRISYEGYQARLNYMSLPNKTWVNFGYSRLLKTDGRKGMVMVKDNVLIQMVVNKQELEDWLIDLLGIDPLQAHKIRFHQFPEGWILESEEFLTHEDLRELEHNSGGTIQEGLQQEIIVDRISVTITYFDCKTPESADLVGQELASRPNSIEKRIVKGYGSIVVAVDSTNADLNRQMFLHMNW